ncbi:hypothetical protein NIES4102_37430 [Chondrocystis sp. NIES-4102]|nr:hypothetical protein NIES4102_37430 [Chondrocystis sp. NIES-4102]
MIPGWAVTRSIPFDTVFGLITGQYKLYGGVIRWAPGTPHAGQIIKHLIPTAFSPLGMIPGMSFIPGIVANIQLGQIQDMTRFNTHQLMQISGQISSQSQITQQILNIATGTAFLSGLGLAVSSVGFASMNAKLNIIDDRLKSIQKDVQAIRYFLESNERARLYAALNALLKIDNKTALEHRHIILHNSRNVFAEINMRYRELLAEANEIQTAMTYEEYFSLTGLAQVRCTAELGMMDIACKEMEEINLFWQAQSRHIAKTMLIGIYPERFLASDFAYDISITELVEWLDFTYDQNKGLCWIDELRLNMNEHWYSGGFFVNQSSGLNKKIGVGLDKEKQVIIPALRNILARSSVLESYTTQYALLESQKLKPSDFEQQIADISESELVEGYLLLEPIIEQPVEVGSINHKL